MTKPMKIRRTIEYDFEIERVRSCCYAIVDEDGVTVDYVESLEDAEEAIHNGDYDSHIAESLT